MYETFEHTADLGLRITARELPQLYEEAAQALFSVIVSDPALILPRRQVQFDLQSTSLELLLLDWLNELLFAFETRQLLLGEFSVTLCELRLQATARGEPVDPPRHSLEHEVKAITYHGLQVSRVEDGWRAEVILDI